MALKTQPLKILIVRFSSIGDIVLTTPVIRCLKKQLPSGSQIHFLTKPQFAILLQNNTYLDKLLLLKSTLNETIAEIKNENYDRIIDLHNNFRTLLIKWRTGVPAYSFDKLNFQKLLMVKFKINRLPAIHIVDRYMKTIEKLGVKNDGEGLDYFGATPADELRRNFEELNVHEFITMAIGGQHATKRMPVYKLEEIIVKSDYKIVLLGGKEDKEVAAILEANHPEKVINMAGKLSLNQSAGCIALSKLLITHDTGMMHIAAALKKPLLAIWGNTIPEFGMYAYYGNLNVFYKNFEVPNLKCRPCSKLGFDECPKGHFKCMNEQDTGKIIESINHP